MPGNEHFNKPQADAQGRNENDKMFNFRWKILKIEKSIGALGTYAEKSLIYELIVKLI